MKSEQSRRVFLETLGTCAIGAGAMPQLWTRRASAGSLSHNDVVPQSNIPINPNILIVIVDQMRYPAWLSSAQRNTLNNTFLSNISGRIRNSAYIFQQYYTAGTVCTASRATLMTGLYSPQTAVYVGQESGAAVGTPLNPAFPTWASAIQSLNSAYQGNVWWFGKWHLSPCTTTDPLQPYCIRTRTYPGGTACNPSPDGAPNEGTDGGLYKGVWYASDADIASDFTEWISNGEAGAGPWCATVSLINPHDICGALAWTGQTGTVPPPNLPLKQPWFPAPTFPPPGLADLLTAAPNPWNFETPGTAGKPALQAQAVKNMDKEVGAIAGNQWPMFLNQYYSLQNYVDQQVGNVLDALTASGYADNTIVVFVSDHGEYAGSHGMHDKGYAIYDESIHVPLYVKFPKQARSISLSQMCSSVDFFGLVCDLATAGAGSWKTNYPDLQYRQSLCSFMSGGLETRRSPVLNNAPYILHTCDVTCAGADGNKNHIVGLRTKTDSANSIQPGAKLGVYSEWGTCSTLPDSTPPDYEFYDYDPNAANNWKELGNDFNGSARAQTYLQALGLWAPIATGTIAGELNRPLTGTGLDGLPLSETRAGAIQVYLDYVNSSCLSVR